MAKSTILLKREDGISNDIRNIGDLPEPILVYILSFLPMKDAVRTSVLSKGWRLLWKYIPNLTFNEPEWCCSNRNRELFMDFVDSVLVQYRPSNIKEFSLIFTILRCEDRFRFDGWLSNVLEHNVREFSLVLGRVEECRSFWLPPCLFTGDTLVQLNLGFMYSTTLNLPSQIHLPNLKVLNLQNAKFLDECSLRRLLSSPALQILGVNSCNLEKISAVSICAPKLKHLTITEHEYNPLHGGIPLDHRCQVMVYDCNLISLDLSGCIINEYSTSNLSAISVDLSNQSVDHLGKILHGIRAVHKLTIDEAAIVSVEEGVELISRWSDMPALNALNTLQLGYFEMIIFWKILQSTPRLCTLQLHEGIYYDGKYEEIFDPVPLCFVSSLKEIIIDRLFLEEGVLHVLKTMLKHALVLKEFVISAKAARIKEHPKWHSFGQKLMACPRGSESCKIII